MNSDIRKMPIYSNPLLQTIFQGIPENERSLTKVSFFVIADKTFAFKKIDLSDFLKEHGAEQLNQWGKEKRLAAVTQKGQEVFAHVSSQMAVNIQGKDVLIDGVKATARVLSEDEYEQMTKVSEAVRVVLAEEGQPIESQELAHPYSNFARSQDPMISMKEYFHAVSMFIGSMQQIPEKIKQNLLNRWQENLRSIEKESREDEKVRRKKVRDVDNREIARSEHRTEIQRLEAKKKNELLMIDKSLHLKRNHSQAEQG